MRNGLGRDFGGCGVSETLNLAINFLTQIGPDLFVHLEEDFNYFGIELLSLPAVDFGASRGQGLRGPVRSIGSDSVESIGDREIRAPSGISSPFRPRG